MFCLCSLTQETELEGVPEAQHELFRKYYALTIDELKDFMRWNNQPIGGTKVRLEYISDIFLQVCNAFNRRGSLCGAAWTARLMERCLRVLRAAAGASCGARTARR
jgi:hypothetical protein